MRNRATAPIDIDWISEQSAWQCLADRVEAPLPQRWIYGAAGERLGRDVHRLVATQNGHPLAIVQLLSKPFAGTAFYLATRGPLFLENCDRRAVIAALRRALPRLSLKLMTPEENYGRLRLSARTTVCDLDLAQPLDQLRARLHGKWRNGLKRAENTRLKVAELSGSPVVMMPLLRAEKERQSQAKYRAIPPEFTLAIQDVAPNSIRLFAASDAHMLFIRHGNSATYQIGHSGAEGRAQNAHALMLWHAIGKLKSEGVTRLDLGTIDEARAENLARFKLRTGAAPRQLGAATLM